MTRDPDRMNRCAGCGSQAEYSTPEESDDDEGYHYVICGEGCGRESSWGKTKAAAVRDWNERNKP